MKIQANNCEPRLSKSVMTARILLVCIAATVLTGGCAKDLSANSIDRGSRMDFHARGMIVPDFNVGTTPAPVSSRDCRQAATLRATRTSDG